MLFSPYIFSLSSGEAAVQAVIAQRRQHSNKSRSLLAPQSHLHFHQSCHQPSCPCSAPRDPQQVLGLWQTLTIQALGSFSGSQSHGREVTAVAASKMILLSVLIKIFHLPLISFALYCFQAAVCPSGHFKSRILNLQAACRAAFLSK